MTQRLQEILDEARRRVQEWPEWRKSEALKASEGQVDSGSPNSAELQSASRPSTQCDPIRRQG